MWNFLEPLNDIFGAILNAVTVFLNAIFGALAGWFNILL